MQDQMADALRMANGVRDRDRSALRDTEQGKALTAARVGDRFEIAHPCLERQLGVPIGQSASARVITDQRVVERERAQPMSPHRARAIEFQMTQPVRRLDERRSRAGRRIGDAHAVVTFAKADLLRNCRHREDDCEARRATVRET